MSKGKKNRERAAARRGKGNQNAMGGGKYGNRHDLESGADFLGDTPWAGMDPETEINVIVSVTPEKPPGAGRHLGVLKEPFTDARGQRFEEGWHLWAHDGEERPGFTKLSLNADPGELAHVLDVDPRRAHEIQAHLESRQLRGLNDERPVTPGPRGRTGFNLKDWPAEVAQLQERLGLNSSDPGRWSVSRAFRAGDADAASGPRAYGGENRLLGRNARPDAESLQAELLIQALEVIEPGLAARAAEGLGEAELERLSPQIIAALDRAQELAAELVASDVRARELIAGSDSGRLIGDGAQAEAVPVRLNWTADQVLDTQAWLARFYASGSQDLSDFLAHSIRSAQEEFSDPGKVNTMFWPVETGNVLAGRAEGQLYAAVMAHGLRDARTYQVTAPMVDQMRAAIMSAPLSRGLDARDMPAHAGFCWLDRPWVMLEAAGYWMPFRAISWEKVSVLARDENERVRSVDAVRIVLWTLISDDEAFGRWSDPKRASRAATAIGQLTPQHFLLLNFYHRYNLNPGYEEQGRDMLSLVHMLWRFLGMELSATRQPPASTATAARVKKSLKHASVHIVTLRRTNYISDELPGHRDVRYSVRWWVDDFQRHIDHYDDIDAEGRRRRHEAVPAGRVGGASDEDHDDDHDVCAVCLANGQTVRITPVRGHIRGPEHLPLKPVAHDRTVFKLSR